MKVKIQHTVDFDSIPSEVIRLLSRWICESIPSSLSEISKLINEGNVSKSIEKIDNLRKFLYDGDTVLSDAQSILLSYEKERLNQMSETEAGQVKEPEEENGEIDDS